MWSINYLSSRQAFNGGIIRVLANIGNRLPTQSRLVPLSQYNSWTLLVNSHAEALQLEPELVANAFLILFPMRLLDSDLLTREDVAQEDGQPQPPQTGGPISASTHQVQQLPPQQPLQPPLPDQSFDPTKCALGTRTIGRARYPFDSPCIRPSSPNCSNVPGNLGVVVVPYLSDASVTSKPSLVHKVKSTEYILLKMGRGPLIISGTKRKRGFSYGTRREIHVNTGLRSVRPRTDHGVREDGVERMNDDGGDAGAQSAQGGPQNEGGAIGVSIGNMTPKEFLKAQRDMSNQSMGAHTFIAWLKAGEPTCQSPSVCAMHLCDTRTCVNPLHIWWGTYSNNAASGKSQNSATVYPEVIRQGITSDNPLGVQRRDLATEVSLQ